MNKRRLMHFIFILSVGFLLSVIWEHYLEEPAIALLGYSNDESQAMHWRFVFYETLIIAVVGLAYGIVMSHSDKAMAISEKELHLSYFSLRNSNDSIFWLSPDGTIRYHNPATEALLGYSAEQLRSMKFYDLKVPPHTSFLETLWREIKSEKSKPLEAQLKRADGTMVDVEISLVHLSDGKFTDEYIFVFIRDISRRKEAETALWKEKRKYFQLSEAIYDGFAVVEHGVIKEVSESFALTLGRNGSELIEKEFASLVSPCLDFVNTIFSPHHLNERFVVYAQYPDGNRKYFETYWVPLTYYGAAVFAVALRDISETLMFQKQLSEMALHDPLTKLPNRQLLAEHLTHYISLAKRQHSGGVLCYIDLDNFKAVNDRLGHEAGDSVLVTIANNFLACLRQEDILARIGGDEYAVVMPNIQNSREDISVIANRLIKSANVNVPMGDGTINVGASIGIVQFPAQGELPENLLSKADEAMYQAKEKGKNRYSFAS